MNYYKNYKKLNEYERNLKLQEMKEKDIEKIKKIIQATKLEKPKECILKLNVKQFLFIYKQFYMGEYEYDRMPFIIRQFFYVMGTKAGIKPSESELRTWCVFFQNLGIVLKNIIEDINTIKNTSEKTKLLKKINDLIIYQEYFLESPDIKEKHRIDFLLELYNDKLIIENSHKTENKYEIEVQTNKELQAQTYASILSELQPKTNIKTLIYINNQAITTLNFQKEIKRFIIDAKNNPFEKIIKLFRKE